jgi:hypothetical protein
MKKLDFLVIGTQKGGTTSLINQFNQHPDIFMCENEFTYMKEKYSEKNKKLFDYLGYDIKEWA